MILAIDPSSSKIGYALMPGREKLLDAGVLTPRRVRDPAIVRIHTMADAVVKLIRDEKPSQIIIEIPSGKVAAHNRAAMAGRGLGVLGMAAGAVWWAALSTGVPTATVDERTWTGCRPKRIRQIEIMDVFPQYAAMAAKDPGLDIADAIGIGRWWFLNEQIKREGLR